MPPPPKPPPPHRLEITRNSIYNTTLHTADDKLHYEVRTPWWEKHITRINKIDWDTREMRTVAEIERRPGKKGRNPSYKVRFNVEGGKLVMKRDGKGEAAIPEEEKNGEWFPVGEWLKYDPVAVGGTFTDREGTEYRWKTHNRRLQLVKEKDEEKVPIVKYHKHRRHWGVYWRMRQHAWLEVKPEVDVGPGDGNMLDRLIVTYVLVERRRRDATLRIKLEHS